MDQHVEGLRAVSQRLADNGLAINLEKCEFVGEELDFLGHRLSAWHHTDLQMFDFPRPHTVKKLQ
jgi:hypothetical protein